MTTRILLIGGTSLIGCLVDAELARRPDTVVTSITVTGWARVILDDLKSPIAPLD